MKNEEIKLYKLTSRFKRGEEKYMPLACISTKKFYVKVWNDAIKSQKIKLFKYRSSFSAKKIDPVIKELQSILAYCKIKYSERSLWYHLFNKAIEQLLLVIEKERHTNAKFYIL